ncbi:uncharacterized protein [Physcomitrium patens]|uniref:uncharacterized protein n=1 Tax=Physcomitrium patens TaxID=3218 RepID=UPI003CCDD914
MRETRDLEGGKSRDGYLGEGSPSQGARLPLGESSGTWPVRVILAWRSGPLLWPPSQLRSAQLGFFFCFVDVVVVVVDLQLAPTHPPIYPTNLTHQSTPMQVKKIRTRLSRLSTPIPIPMNASFSRKWFLEFSSLRLILRPLVGSRRDLFLAMAWTLPCARRECVVLGPRKEFVLFECIGG